MTVLDVNVVLAAHRVDHRQFEHARGWIDGLVRSAEHFCVPDMVAGSFCNTGEATGDLAPGGPGRARRRSLSPT